MSQDDRAPAPRPSNAPAAPPEPGPTNALQVQPPSALLAPQVLAEPPVETEGLRVGPAPQAAGGMPAIVSTMRHALGKMGAVRTFQTLSRLNQKGGFDCQSCAWPDPDGERDLASFCENGAKAVADEAMTARIGPEFFRRYSVQQLSEQSDHWLNRQGRLTHPMLLREGGTHYEPVSWDEAFALVARELNALASPDEALFYTSGRTSNEAAFLYQLFVRQLGTNNLPDCSNMCHESSGQALNEVIGIGKGTVTLEDFAKTDLVIVVGQNPGTNHPRMLTTLQEAKRRGAKLLTINPLPEAGLQRFKHPQEVFDTLVGKGTQLTDQLLQIRINGDMAVLQGIMKELLDEEAKRPGEVLDHAFIREHTTNFEALAASLREVSWELIVEQSGVSRAEIRAAAELVLQARTFIICWAMGLTQHKNAVATIQELVNLCLLRGSIGKPGAGLCPVRGHSNVQGDRTVGIWERPKEPFLAALDREFGFTSPRKHGLDVVAAIRAMHAGEAKVFFAMGGNFLSATPDTHYTAEALRRTRLTVQVSTKLNRSHLVHGRQALILPCLGRSEVDLQAGGAQFVSCENSMGVVQSSEGKLEPASEHLLSEPAIVARLARATLGERSRVDWEGMAADYDRIRDAISRVIPGFEDYNARVRRPGGFYLPNAPRENRYPTATGKANFTVHQFPRHQLAPGQLVLMTIRTHDQFNTTIYGLDDRYRGIYNGRRVILMHPEDVRALGLREGQFVDLTSHFEGERRTALRFAVVPFAIARGCAASYFPETNVLVPIGSTAERSHTPTSKYVVITLAPSEAPQAGRLTEGTREPARV
ncbi:FdhF/YdeP family oxidoreductase [Aggregicoccus sp. 17bor-14]|uniref:FdhF/YdeP family oxidoreductase n=1 Tax=Myxococcaceae TaxID=31 RepID=UPI00129C9B85|nr:MULTISPECIES: FdhF/YdeP family oxidoreductase [Myxococcaceae]MBF5041140.1 FdhF/YdeP family oxidoreductase [Simulacricoccus sp. 17bor-14]MRI86927.1 FdhF/YdeP family oxidoreductase [Aggregicoccus sp. 17bor-14]